jgi:hypothetical protein
MEGAMILQEHKHCYLQPIFIELTLIRLLTLLLQQQKQVKKQLMLTQPLDSHTSMKTGI